MLEPLQHVLNRITRLHYIIHVANLIIASPDHDNAPRRVDVHLEPPVGGDDPVVVVVVQVRDVVALGVVQPKLLKGHRDLHTKAI